MASMLTAVVAMLARVVTAATLRMLRPLALNLFGRTLEAPERLAQGFYFALVGGLLALGLLEQFQQFIELVQGIAQRRDDFHDLVDGFSHGCGLGRSKVAKRAWDGSSFAAWRRGNLRTFLYVRFRRLLWNLHLR